MPTNSAFARLYNKKILGLTQLKDQVVDYLRTSVKEAVSQFFGSGDAAFSQIIPITANASAMMIDIGKATPATGNYYAADGNGHIITLSPNSLNGIKIPPAAVLFDVALYVSEVEDGVEVNPRTGEIEYSTTKETIGQVTTPTAVVDNTNTLTFTVDGLFDTSTDHSGRQVRIWMKPKGVSGSPGPQSSVASVAIETCTVVYSGGANKITTASHFGTAATYVANASHFYIQCVGPTVRKRTTQDLRSAQGYMYLGSVTSPGSGVIPGGNITTAEQSLVSISMTEVGQVLYKDAHGSIKIKVKADASDVDVSQLEVQDSTGAAVWKIDEDGDVTLAGAWVQSLVKTGNGNFIIGTGNTSNGDTILVAAGLSMFSAKASGSLDAFSKVINNVGAPVAAGDALRKETPSWTGITTTANYESGQPVSNPLAIWVDPAGIAHLKGQVRLANATPGATIVAAGGIAAGKRPGVTKRFIIPCFSTGATVCIAVGTDGSISVVYFPSPGVYSSQDTWDFSTCQWPAEQ